MQVADGIIFCFVNYHWAYSTSSYPSKIWLLPSRRCFWALLDIRPYGTIQMLLLLLLQHQTYIKTDAQKFGLHGSNKHIYKICTTW